MNDLKRRAKIDLSLVFIIGLFISVIFFIYYVWLTQKREKPRITLLRSSIQRWIFALKKIAIKENNTPLRLKLDRLEQRMLNRELIRLREKHSYGRWFYKKTHHK